MTAEEKLKERSWFRKLALQPWLLNPKKGWLERLAFPCNHTHTFKHYLPSDTPWYFNGEKKGIHDALVIEGCYLCGECKVRDWKA